MSVSSKDHSDTPATVFEIPVQWADLDALNHVNNVVYISNIVFLLTKGWFQEARVFYFAHMDSPLGWILAETTCKYLKPVSWPGR